MKAPAEQPWYDYDYAFVRVVPRVHLGTFVNVGVVLHARTAGFLGVRLHCDAERIAALCPGSFDYETLVHHLEAYERVSRGGPGAGPIGLLPASERFHWLTAPRSAVLQTSEVHAGRTANPEATLEHLYRTCVVR